MDLFDEEPDVITVSKKIKKMFFPKEQTTDNHNNNNNNNNNYTTIPPNYSSLEPPTTSFTHTQQILYPDQPSSIISEEENFNPFRLALNIKTLSGHSIQIEVAFNDTVMRVKELIEESQGIPSQQQRLIYQGKTMADSLTINDYGLKNRDTLHMVLALRGG